MDYIYGFNSSKENSIKVLYYIYGRKYLNKAKSQVVFINAVKEHFDIIENYVNDSFSYIFRDSILDKDIEGFNIKEL